jgi:hypothetical protein
MHESQQECTSSTRSKTETPSELVSHFSAVRPVFFIHSLGMSAAPIKFLYDGAPTPSWFTTEEIRQSIGQPKRYYLPERATCLISFKMHDLSSIAIERELHRYI